MNLHQEAYFSPRKWRVVNDEGVAIAYIEERYSSNFHNSNGKPELYVKIIKSGASRYDCESMDSALNFVKRYLDE